MAMMKLKRCTLLFTLGVAIVCFGIGVISTSLGTLAITSSYIGVFPFGAPLWIGTLFITLGCFMLVAYWPSRLQLPASSRTRVWFTLLVSLLAIVECLLALSLRLWYRNTVFPSLQDCTADLTSASPLRSGVTCECTDGLFVDPPSLRVTIHRFAGVSDCSSLGSVLGWFHWALLGLYGAGGILSALAVFLAARRLHSFGVFGKSGVYAVTPKPTTPTPDITTNQQQPFVASPAHSVPPSAGIMSPALPGFILNQRCPGGSSPATLSTLHSHSPSTLRSQAPRLRQISSTSSQSATAV